MKTYCKYCIEPVSEIENYELAKATNEERLAFKKKCSEARKLYWEKKHESTR